jgi:hypothetical protein
MLKGDKKEVKRRYKKISKEIIEGKETKKVMLENGYSPMSAHTPAKITKKKSFQEALDEVMPQEFVLDAHKRLYSEHRDIKQIRLETTDDEVLRGATEGFDCISTIKNEEEGYTLLIINQVDRQARKDSIELAYKLRGSFSPTQIEVKREYEDIPDDELLALLKDTEGQD